MRAQLVDPDVSRLKFERELGEYRQLEAEYRQRGWLLVEARFPRVLVVLTAPKLKPAAVVTGVAFDYTNYDMEPPSVRLVNPFTGVPYAAKELPVALNRSVPGAPQELPGMPPGAQFQLVAAQSLMQAGRPDDVPFVCISGVREYHEHPGHSGDPWEIHRAQGEGRLVRLLEVIHKYGIQPISSYNVSLVPQIGFGFGQPPE